MAKRKTVPSRAKTKKDARPSGAKKARARISAKKSPAKAKPPKKKATAAKKKASPAAKERAVSSTKAKTSSSRAKKAAPAAKKTTTGRATRKVSRPSQAASLSPPAEPVIIAGIEIVPRSKPLPKTKLRVKELREFKELLLTKRRELLGDVTQLSNEALHTNRQESRGDLSNMPSHMADIGSDNWEQEFTLGLIATERSLLRQIDAALERIKNRIYGVCLATHRMISPERLRAKPWAQYCIEFARLRETGRVPPGLI